MGTKRPGHYGPRLVRTEPPPAAAALALDPKRYEDDTTLTGGEEIAAELKITPARLYKLKHKNRGPKAPPIRHIAGVGMVAVRGPLLRWWDIERGLVA